MGCEGSLIRIYEPVIRHISQSVLYRADRDPSTRSGHVSIFRLPILDYERQTKGKDFELYLEMGKRTLVKDLNKRKIKTSEKFCGKDIVGFLAQLYCATVSLSRSPENLYGFQFRVHHPVLLNTKALIELSLGNFVLFAGSL
jgi:hypothetical protein